MKSGLQLRQLVDLPRRGGAVGVDAARRVEHGFLVLGHREVVGVTGPRDDQPDVAPPESRCRGALERVVNRLCVFALQLGRLKGAPETAGLVADATAGMLPLRPRSPALVRHGDCLTVRVRLPADVARHRARWGHGSVVRLANARVRRAPRWRVRIACSCSTRERWSL
jgi:hypothetical protein